jgi:hypothetical protein
MYLLIKNKICYGVVSVSDINAEGLMKLDGRADVSEQILDSIFELHIFVTQLKFEKTLLISVGHNNGPQQQIQ